MDYKEGLKPLIGNNAKVLILGSLPGDESLRKQEYYSNSNNRFWDVMSGILEENVPISYSDKVEYLKCHGIALWDVLHSAEREGSLDANIRNDNDNEDFNDIAKLVSDNPSIEVIAINGGEAKKKFKKYLRKHTSLHNKRIYYCASTSGMSRCSGWTLEKLVCQWGEIL